MKTIIIGKKGVGKTFFIKDMILKHQQNPLIFDLNDEYKEIKSDFIHSLVNLTLKEINHVVSDVIMDSDKEKTIILDSFTSFLLMKKTGSKSIASFEWLNNILKGKKSILTLNSVQGFNTYKFDEIKRIYLFPTMDSHLLKKDFTTKYKNIIQEINPITHENN